MQLYQQNIHDDNDRSNNRNDNYHDNNDGNDIITTMTTIIT